MMWGAFGYYGKSELQSVPVRSNSSDYQAILQSGLIRDGSKMGGRGWIFQQDNAPIHTSASTRAWLATKKVRLLDWPARSPDLNPMENLWGYLSQKVYAHGRQYSSKRELEEAIFREWDAIPQEYLQGLTESMKTRVL